MVQNTDDANSGAPVRLPAAASHYPHLKLVTDAVESVLDSVQPLATAAPSLKPQPGFAPRRIAETLATLGSKIEPAWIVRGYVAPGLVTLLAAKPKVGKSTLAASLVAAAKDGGEWLGLPVRQCRTLWLDLEMGESQTARALQRAGLKDGDVWLWSGHRDGFDLDEVRAFLEHEKIDLLVIDSFSKYSRVDDENNNAKLTKEMNTIVRIARELNVAILVIHHQKKTTDGNIDDLRGAGAIAADADIILNLYRMPNAPQSNPRRKLVGLGRFVDITPSDTRLTFRDGRYVLDGPGSAPALPKRQQEALDALANAQTPLFFGQWEEASKQSGSTFKTARKALVELGYVCATVDNRYELTEAGRAAAKVTVEGPLLMVGPTLQSP